MKISIPKQAQKIIEQLEQSGYEAYVVGGCVRDSILGKEPQDWDITTSARPTEMKKIFSHTVDTGIEHGTVTVLMDHEPYEVTTYRVDGDYEDHRRPNEVEFTTSLKEDMLRRDFTINAMAYNPREGLIDLYEGMEDIHKKRIRCVGVARERFDEDALRILRALRFQAQLGFTIEEKTKTAIGEQAKYLKDISAERIQVELDKLITSQHPEVLLDAYHLGVTKIILPEFDQMMETPQHSLHHCYDVGTHTVEAMKLVKDDHILRWTMLLHDCGKPVTRVDKGGRDSFIGHQDVGEEMARKILRRLKFDNKTVHQVSKLVCWHDRRFATVEEVNERTVRRWLNQLEEEGFRQLLDIQWADMGAQSDYHREEKVAVYAKTKEIFEQIISRGDGTSVKDLAISGKDLLDQGMAQGKELGSILTQLLEQVLDDPSLNNRQTLLSMAEEMRKKS